MMMETGDTTSDTLGGPTDVLGLLREQALMYAKLETFAKRQRLLVSGDDVGALLSLLAQRQKLAERLARIGSQLAPYRRDWNRHRDEFDSAQRDEAERLLADSQGHLRRVIEGDEEDARLLSIRKATVAAKLSETHSTSQAIKAYGAPTGHSGRLDCMDGNC